MGSRSDFHLKNLPWGETKRDCEFGLHLLVALVGLKSKSSELAKFGCLLENRREIWDEMLEDALGMRTSQILLVFQASQWQKWSQKRVNLKREKGGKIRGHGGGAR